MKHLILCLCLLGFTISPALAEERGTKEEAIVIAEAVKKHFDAHGAEDTFQKITEKGQSEFFSKDLYPFVYDVSGKNAAHGVKPHLVGKDLIGLKDQGGKELIKEMVEIAKTGQTGWVDYKWPDPSSGGISDKSSYILPLDSTYFVGVGIYK